ncbi:hypothetical protein GE061_006858 [Apolygus lucorum]|uniref:Zinc phosphodiesterase ELAC protein 2 n=1 Tax=Apolygus lucorum TaxID=248454 RepID=A0A8S9WTW1_APOLU|nr:hypothetical protein GE061_006858 [Apolygus lucorum]
MPKESTHAITLKAQRLKIKEKGQKYPPGTVTLQVLGSGAKGAPRSLYLFTDQSRYLFNCGEGTQRLAHEHKMKLSKLEHIFITQGTWQNLGGLPGVVLTIQDVGVPEITLHGPSGVDEIFTATKRFVVLKNMTVKAATCSPNNVYEDNAIRVSYVPIAREKASTEESDSGTEQGSSDDDIDYYGHAVDTNPNKNTPKAVLKTTTPESPSHNKAKDVQVRRCVMCYIVRLQPRPGSLCLEKCVEAGVPPGPLLGRLKGGEDVVLDDGRIVRSSDVTMSADPGPVFLVVECPDESFLDSFVQNSAFSKYQVGQAGVDEMPMLVAHFSPRQIIENPKYKEWMEKFSPSTHHLILNEGNTCMGSSAVHRIQHKLNLLEPSVFPLLQDHVVLKESMCPTPNSEVSSDISARTNSTPDLGYDFNIVNAKTFCNISLRPRKPLDNCTKVVCDPEEYKSEVMNIEGFPVELNKLASQLGGLAGRSEGEYPNVIFLGTGSCIPNKTRNTSGILLNISDDKCMLVDCGEGTYGQLVRFYGPEEVDRILSNLKAIYISHLHADHHIGLIGVIKGIARVRNNARLYLLAPKQIMFWLNMYDKHFENILQNVELVANQDLLFSNYQLDEGAQKSLKCDLGFERVETTFVKHCPNAFGVTFRHVDGWKIAYSGDTMPCDSFVELGKGSDLLIHEATMEDELKEEALIKLHSTTSEAVDVGRRMDAGFTMLTHFSQRYAKLPRLGETGTFGDNVGIAFDNMKVRFQDLPKLKHLYPTLRLMFQDDVDELETKAFKRQMKQERELKKKQKL